MLYDNVEKKLSKTLHKKLIKYVFDTSTFSQIKSNNKKGLYFSGRMFALHAEGQRFESAKLHIDNNFNKLIEAQFLQIIINFLFILKYQLIYSKIFQYCVILSFQQNAITKNYELSFFQFQTANHYIFSSHLHRHYLKINSTKPSVQKVYFSRLQLQRSHNSTLLHKGFVPRFFQNILKASSNFQKFKIFYFKFFLVQIKKVLQSAFIFINTIATASRSIFLGNFQNKKYFRLKIQFKFFYQILFTLWDLLFCKFLIIFHETQRKFQLFLPYLRLSIQHKQYRQTLNLCPNLNKGSFALFTFLTLFWKNSQLLSQIFLIPLKREISFFFPQHYDVGWCAL
eukprot:TRINITY_DN11401_c0_g1_i1.p1 TRINITY_DN11401_c0_g1~~TRINITY_DN11401_c0_g1_i1.p1  ORF type:complete len:340 (+),score=-26.68 TRINITY_DN11401_c0_g1_i1:215-1234(+)